MSRLAHLNMKRHAEARARAFAERARLAVAAGGCNAEIEAEGYDDAKDRVRFNAGGFRDIELAAYQLGWDRYFAEQGV